jgi:hypothetical protein
MRSARASRCSNRGPWTACPSAIVAVRREACPKGSGVADGRRKVVVPTSPAADPAEEDARASLLRASRD